MLKVGLCRVIWDKSADKLMSVAWLAKAALTLLAQLLQVKPVME